MEKDRESTEKELTDEESEKELTEEESEKVVGGVGAGPAPGAGIAGWFGGGPPGQGKGLAGSAGQSLLRRRLRRSIQPGCFQT